MVKRIAACVLVLACLVSLLVVPVSAADADGSVTLTWRLSTNSNFDQTQTSVLGDLPVSGSSLEFGGNSATRWRLSFQDVSFDVSELSGSVSAYFSCYGVLRLSDSVSYENTSVTSTDFSYLNANGQLGHGVAEISSYTVGSLYPGFSMSASTVASELEPISNIAITPSGDVSILAMSSNPNRYQGTWVLNVTSARVVATASSADTEYLESIADEIAHGNEQALAFYGDIISILNEIYSKETEIEVTVDQVADYILQALKELASIGDDVESMYTLMSTYLHYLESIAQDTESIDSTLTQFHADFMTMLQTLISTITSESDDIQEKMEEIYNMLIAYLNQQFGDAVPDGIDQDITDTSDVIDKTDQIESEWQDDMTSGWGDLDLPNYTLPTSLLAGVVWVSSWFSNIFNAYGADWSQILLVPALFGIVMLAIGMISRHSGGGRGGGGRGGGAGGSDSTSNTSDGSWHYTDHY